MKKGIKFLIAFIIVFTFGSIHTRVNAETKTTFTADDYIYTVLSSSDKTVAFTGIAGEITATTITIPKTVIYENETYTVTSVDYDSKYQLFDSVTSIVVPESVTEEFVITNSLINESMFLEHSEPDLVPFPYLTDITFLSATAPKKISILTYLAGYALTYHVPDGSEASYEAIAESNQQLLPDRYDAIDGDSTYKAIDIKPVIVSSSQPEKESELFSTEYGVYLVTKSAADGQGEVTLIDSKKLVPVKEYETEGNMIYVRPYWGEYTMESEVSYKNYDYTVTGLGKNALAGIQVAVLTIPDTITQMEDHCIDATDLKAIFFSANCRTIPAKVFITGENDANLALIYFPATVTELKENALSCVVTANLVVPKNAKHASTEYNKCNIVTETTTSSNDVEASGLTVPKDTLTTKISQTKSLGVTIENTNSTEAMMYVSLDNGTAKVSQKGVVTPKHKGTGYIVAFTSRSGKHSMMKVTVKDTTFTSGIYTYRVNYDTKATVTIIGCSPKSSTTKLVFPSTVTYNKKKYTVTQIMAGDSMMDESRVFEYTGKNGYPRTYDYQAPLIAAKTAKKSNITEIVIPATVKLQVSNLGELPKLKIIRFKGTTVPTFISMTKSVLSNATVYIPKKAITAYKKTTWQVILSDSEWRTYTGWEKKSKYVLKTY